MIGIEPDPPLSFIDSNIIVYALNQDGDERSPIANHLIDWLGAAHAFCTSTQVLQESFATLTRKGKRLLSAAEALTALDRIAEFPVVMIDYPLIAEAGRLAERDSFSLWDALIVSAAARARAKRVYTDDLQHGRVVLGVEIVNPFRRR